MKRYGIVLAAVFVSLAVITGCAGEEESQEAAVITDAAYEDGIYFAQDEDFSASGWKYVASFEVENGEFIWAEWNAVHRDSGPDKKTYDQRGLYQMAARGGAQAEWYEQAERTEKFLLETQDPQAVTYTTDDGHTDDISGVTIQVSRFFDLVEQALDQGPVGRGPYEDGVYYAAVHDFSNGWKSTMALNVITGYIAGVNWSGVNRDGDDKKTIDRAGEYQMVARGGAQAEWYEQAERVEQYLIETQDAQAISVDDGGYTDAVSAVTIRISDFKTLAQQALQSGPVDPPLYEDGLYSAEGEDFSSSGWKGTIELIVSNGFIAHVNWSGVNRDGEDKKELDKAGEYQMVARGGAQAEWYEQAELVEQHLLETQDPQAISYGDDGRTDAVSGVTIRINEFVTLATEALESAR